MYTRTPLMVILSIMMTTTVPAATPPDTTTTRLDDLIVTAPGIPWGDGPVSAETLRGRGGANLAEALEHLPGVAAVRRAPSAAEPVIRGLGWERVQTILGAVPLYGACPGRMDPPATYLTPLATSEVSIFRGGGNSAFGPGATGGSIQANPDFERPADTPADVTPFMEAGYESAREGFRTEGGLFGGTRAIDYKVGLGHRKYGDYTAPDGTVVPAGLKSTTANASLGWRPAEGRRLWNAVTYTKEQDVDFPAMPMDNIDTDFLVYNAGWRSEYDGGTVTRFEVTGGVSWVDHFMDNSNKPNRGVMEAGTDAMTRSWAAHAHLDLDPGRSLILKTGLDLTNLTRDATRTRRMVASGAVFHDRLWPDAVQLSGGGFAALEIPLTDVTLLTVDGRLDAVDSRARAADAASLGGRTIREQYVRFYGPEAAETDRTETLGLAGLRLDGRFAPRRLWYLRGGVSSRSAGVTESYYAFGPAPGGFQVGNPTLAAEKKWEAEAGVTLTGEKLSVAVSGFHARIGDYILPTVIAVMDVNGDGNDDIVKGFQNIDAALSGGELGLEYRPTDSLYLPLTLSFVGGRNTTDDRDLPEIPPLSGTAEIRWQAHGDTDTWLRGGAYFAADQDRIDNAFGENRTGGFSVWRLGFETNPMPGLDLGLWVDNLFDKLYNEHLTREALLPTGGLAAGQEIPAPGRSFNVSARMEF
ncbi:MAG: TonB-dependent receptor [Candidatus Krumholzibacteriota bacterium]